MAKRKRKVELFKITIYPDINLLEEIERMAAASDRSISQQMVYLVKKGLELEYVRQAAANKAQRGVERITEDLAHV